MMRTKIILECINKNFVEIQSQHHYESSRNDAVQLICQTREYSTELRDIKFLPVQPQPKDYPTSLSWKGNNYTLFCIDEAYYGERCATLAGSEVCIVCTQEPQSGGCGIIPQCVISGLGIKTLPPNLAVIDHFCHIIKGFFTLKESENSLEVWLTKICLAIYEFLENEAKTLDVLSRKLQWIWTGRQFIYPRAIALKSQCNGPYLFHVPDNLNGKTRLLEALKIKSDFTIDDFSSTLEQMKKDFQDTPINEDCRALVLPLLRELVSILKRSPTYETQNFYLPDLHNIMRMVRDLSYNDDPECKLPKEVFISEDVSRDFAITLGVRPIRSRFLKKYEDEDEGQEFGQSEDLTQE